MEFYKNIIKKRIANYAIANLQRLDPDIFLLGAGLFNLRCYQNSAHQVIAGQAKKILFCICIDESSRLPFLHFINQLENGCYQDNTLGYEHKDCEYYLIREILPAEIPNIYRIFDKARTSLVQAHSQPVARFLFLNSTDFI